MTSVLKITGYCGACGRQVPAMDTVGKVPFVFLDAHPSPYVPFLFCIGSWTVAFRQRNR